MENELTAAIARLIAAVEDMPDTVACVTLGAHRYKQEFDELFSASQNVKDIVKVK